MNQSSQKRPVHTCPVPGVREFVIVGIRAVDCQLVLEDRPPLRRFELVPSDGRTVLHVVGGRSRGADGPELGPEAAGASASLADTEMS